MVAQPFIPRPTTDWWPIDSTGPLSLPMEFDSTTVTNWPRNTLSTIGFFDNNRTLQSKNPRPSNRHEQRKLNAAVGRKPKPSRRRHKSDK